MRKSGLIIAAMVFALPVMAAPLPAPAIDNDDVTVWDITLQKGETAPATPADRDVVVMFLEGGRFKPANSDNAITRKFGDAAFIPKGRPSHDTLVSGGPAHEIMVALKQHAETAVPNPTKYPLAFPRPGSVKVLENAKVIVWRYNWTKGQPTPMHFHDKDVVVAYRYDGALRSVTPDGTVTENAYKKGDIRFNKGNRTHSELVTTDRQSAVILELK
jgi:hypothetical protein